MGVQKRRRLKLTDNHIKIAKDMHTEGKKSLLSPERWVYADQRFIRLLRARNREPQTRILSVRHTGDKATDEFRPHRRVPRI